MVPPSLLPRARQTRRIPLGRRVGPPILSPDWKVGFAKVPRLRGDVVSVTDSCLVAGTREESDGLTRVRLLDRLTAKVNRSPRFNQRMTFCEFATRAPKWVR